MPKGVYKRTKPIWNKGLTYKGTPCSEETRIKIIKAVPRGSKSKNWKGDNVGYLGIHAWIRKIKGKPPKVCVDCNRTDRKRYDWSNIDHKYSRNPKDYFSRCRGCHIRFDIKNNGVKRINSKNIYKGVYKQKGRKWRAMIFVDGKNKHIGSFDDIKKAAQAHNEEALKYYGKSACLNKI